MPVRTRQPRSRNHSNVLKDTTNVKKIQKSSIDYEKVDKDHALEIFVTDFETHVANHEKNMEKRITEFCKSILSVYDVLLRKIPKEYQNMKLKDYLVNGEKVQMKTFGEDINDWVASQLGVIPVKRDRGPKKRGTKLKPARTGSAHIGQSSGDDDYVPPNSLSSLKRKSGSIGNPVAEQLRSTKRLRNDKNNLSTKSATRMMLRSSTLKKSSVKSTQNDENDAVAHSGLNSTVPKSSKYSHLSTTSSRNKATPFPIIEAHSVSNQSTSSSQRRRRSRTQIRTADGVATKKKNPAKFGRKGAASSSSINSCTPVVSTPVTLMCSLQNGTSLTIDLNTDLKTLPLNNQLLENLHAFKQKLTLFLDSTRVYH